MIANTKKEGLYSEFIKEFDVSKQTAYKWLNTYKEELLEKGILVEKRKGVKKIAYITDIEKFLEFMREHGVYLIEE